MIVITSATLRNTVDVDALMATIATVAPLLLPTDSYQVVAVVYKKSLYSYIKTQCGKIRYTNVSMDIYTLALTREIDVVATTLNHCPGDAVCCFVEMGDIPTAEHFNAIRDHKAELKHFVLYRPYADIKLPCYAATAAMWLSGLQAVTAWLTSQWRYVLPLWWHASTVVTELPAAQDSNCYQSAGTPTNPWVVPALPLDATIPSWSKAGKSDSQFLKRAVWPLIATAIFEEGMATSELPQLLSLTNTRGGKMSKLMSDKRWEQWCQGACSFIYHEMRTCFEQRMNAMRDYQ